MGFYGPEPFTNATATYLWLGPDVPGVILVGVEGDAPNFTSGIQLVRDPHFLGGLKVDVMGWTGPEGPGTTPYKVAASFPGLYRDTIVVSGSNKQIVIPVKEIAHDKVDDYLKTQATAKSQASA